MYIYIAMFIVLLRRSTVEYLFSRNMVSLKHRWPLYNTRFQNTQWKIHCLHTLNSPYCYWAWSQNSWLLWDKDEITQHNGVGTDRWCWRQLFRTFSTLSLSLARCLLKSSAQARVTYSWAWLDHEPLLMYASE